MCLRNSVATHSLFLSNIACNIFITANSGNFDMNSFFLAKYCKQIIKIHILLFIVWLFIFFDNRVGILMFYIFFGLNIANKQLRLVRHFCYFTNTNKYCTIWWTLLKVFKVRINTFLSFPVAFVNIEMNTDKTNIIKRSKRVESCCPMRTSQVTGYNCLTLIVVVVVVAVVTALWIKDTTLNECIP